MTSPGSLADGSDGSDGSARPDATARSENNDGTARPEGTAGGPRRPGRLAAITAGAPTGPQWRRAAWLVAVTRLGLLAVSWVAWWLRETGDRDLLSIWRRWDADIYLKIAEHGYTGPDAEPWSEAFLPGLPLLVRGLSSLGVTPVLGSMLITAAASIVAVAYLQRLGDEQVGAGVGHRAALYLLLFPTAVFLVAGYTEALFLAGAVPAFHHARRGEWAAAAPAAALATVSRLAGVFVLAGLLVEVATRHRRRWRPGMAAIAVGAIPLLAYLGWLWHVHGDPLYLLTAQQEGWGRSFVGPLTSLTTTIEAARAATGTMAITWWGEVLGAGIGLVLVAVLVRRRMWPYVAFAGPLLAVLLTSSWYFSVPRVLLSLFPLPLLLAGWTTGRPVRHLGVLGVFAAIAGFGTTLFTRGTWFF